MKILFCMSASVIDEIIESDNITAESYDVLLKKLWGYSLFTTLGYDHNDLKHKLVIFNSKILQLRWAKEKGVLADDEEGMINILRCQIDEFEPDIFYTNNPDFFNGDRLQSLPKCKVYALWRAAPLGADQDLSHFDLGLSYGKIYLDLLKQRGIKNVEQKQFSFCPSVSESIGKLNKGIDISFAGSYHGMFVSRNKLLHKIFWDSLFKYKPQFYLHAPRGRFNRKYIAPFLYLVDRKPVFLNEFLKVLSMSKIVFNCHSDISKQYKGNMRVFEALGMGSFMLSDEGDYPRYLTPGKDFVTYKDSDDLINKINYFLSNEEEREAIATNGQRKLFEHYSLELGKQELYDIFQKYC